MMFRKKYYTYYYTFKRERCSLITDGQQFSVADELVTMYSEASLMCMYEDWKILDDAITKTILQASR